MNLKQYTQQKRRNPLVLTLSIGLTFILVVTIAKNLNTSKSKNEYDSQIVLTTRIENLPDSLYPLFLMKDAEVIKVCTSKLPKDTSFMWKLPNGKSYFKLLDNKYNVISTKAIFFKKEKVVFVSLQSE